MIPKTHCIHLAMDYLTKKARQINTPLLQQGSVDLNKLPCTQRHRPGFILTAEYLGDRVVWVKNITRSADIHYAGSG